MKVERIRDLESLEELHDRWNELLFSLGQNSIFFTYEWVSSWWKSFSEDNTLEILTFKDEGGSLAGIAPFMTKGGLDKSSPNNKVRTLCFIASQEVSDYCDFITLDSRRKEFYVSLLSYLRTNYSDIDKIELIINKYLFRNDILGFTLGILMTLIVQSSSVTTSLIIPLAGAGLITVRQIFPYTVGANIGTTGTAILAAMATQNHIAVTVALAHLCFNIFGIILFYPLKFIPIWLAEFVGKKASQSTKNLVVFVAIYILLHFIPVILIFIT